MIVAIGRWALNEACAQNMAWRRQGLAGSLLAQGLLPPEAAIAAAYLHGLAARLAAAGDTLAAAGESKTGQAAAPIGASDVVRALPAAFRSLYDW